jgi:hypothetical protein
MIFWGGNLMKKSIFITMWSVGLFALALLSSGCETGRVSLVDTGAVAIKTHAPGKVHVAWSDAYTDENGFVVTGVVRRSDSVGPPITVNVHVTLLSPDGKILDEVVSNDISVPRQIASRTQSLERFRLRFPTIPPKGTSAQIVVRSS